MHRLQFCVENKLNMIVSGGTSTGKTVAARKILSLIPPEERVITIEEASELRPEQPNAVTLIADRDADALKRTGERRHTRYWLHLNQANKA